MSSTAAKTFTHQSNRARPTKDSADRKAVFKSALDTPYRIQWPAVPTNIQNSILARTISLVDGVAAYHQQRDRLNRKRKNADRAAKMKEKKAQEDTAECGNKRKTPSGMEVDEESTKKKKRKVNPTPTPAPTTGEAEEGQEPEPPLIPTPSIVDHLTIGINEVTKRLETQVRALRDDIRRASTISLSSHPEPEPMAGDQEPVPPKSPIRVVFVCRGDIDPPLLVAHLPHLVAAYNSSIRKPRPETTDAGMPGPWVPVSTTSTPPVVKIIPAPEGQPILLVPLPKGAEATLAQAMGLRRASVIALDASCPDLSQLDTLFQGIPALSAAWLATHEAIAAAAYASSKEPSNYIPTHIKQVRTTAPKDMKGAKEKRTKGKTEAKLRNAAKKAGTSTDGATPGRKGKGKAQAAKK